MSDGLEWWAGDIEAAEDYEEQETNPAARTGAASAEEVSALRAEIAALREELNGGGEDLATVWAVTQKRRAAQDAAERERKYVEAANDPNTITKLNAINSEEELMSFLKENGMGSNPVG